MVAGSLLLYHPVTRKARIGWHVARLTARAGVLARLPSRVEPPDDVLSLVERVVGDDVSIAVASGTHADRFHFLAVDGDGAPVVFGKLGLTVRAREAIEREGLVLERLARTLPQPLSAPDVVLRTPDMLLTRATRWTVRSRPCDLPVDVASALGRWWRSAEDDEGGRWTHGDLTPWNLLRTSSGWLLVDWEDAALRENPFHDVFHYVVQAHALLGHPSAREVTNGIRGRGRLGAALRAFARSADVDFGELPAAFDGFLRWRLAGPPPDRAADRYRQRLARLLSRGRGDA